MTLDEFRTLLLHGDPHALLTALESIDPSSNSKFIKDAIKEASKIAVEMGGQRLPVFLKIKADLDAAGEVPKEQSDAIIGKYAAESNQIKQATMCAYVATYRLG